MPRGIGREGERSQSAAKDGDCRTVKGSREKSNNRIEQTEEKKPNKKQQHNQPKRKRKKRKKRENEKRKKGKKTRHNKNVEKPKKRTKNPTGANRCAMRQRDGSETPTLWAARRLKRQALQALAAAQPSTGRAALPRSARAEAQKIKAAPKRRQTQKLGEKPNRHSNDDRRIC